MRIQEFAGRKTVIWGFGREGRSVLQTLREKHPELCVTLLFDGAPPESVRQEFSNDQYITITSDTRAVLGADIIVKSPGVSLYRSEIREAQARGIALTSACNIWFAENSSRRTICISGTKGKSTTSSLLAFLLRSAGKSVTLAGNIGTSLLDISPDDSAEYVVVELSSYQIADLSAQPFAAILLNIYPEHLDWHQGFENYARDKFRLLTLVEKDGIRVMNGAEKILTDLADRLHLGALKLFQHSSGWFAEGRSLTHPDGRRISLENFPLLGEHNAKNAAAVFTLLDALPIHLPHPEESLSTFRALPHRLFVAGEKDGVTYVNDSISTVPQAALAALQAFAHRDVTLIVGGFDRGLDWRPFAEILAKSSLARVVTVPSTGTIISDYLESSDEPRKPELFRANNFQHAVLLAKTHTPQGGVILLSPAAPSFGEFENFEKRGEEFLRLTGF